MHITGYSVYVGNEKTDRSDLADGIDMTSTGWNYWYVWNDDSLDVADAVESLGDSLRYLYMYNSKSKRSGYWYPNGQRTDFEKFEKGAMYAFWMNDKATLEYNELVCNDSDGGLNYYEKGEVQVTNAFGSGKDFSDSDWCTNGSVSLLNEKHCSSSSVSGTKSYDCASEGKVCRDGACVESQMKCNPGQKIGDADGDGDIDDDDATLVSKMATDLIEKPEDLCCVDVSQDKSISAYDSALILQIAEGTKQSPGVCGSSEVTYEGVLEMLESCEVVYDSSESKTCDKICRESKNKECVFAQVLASFSFPIGCEVTPGYVVEKEGFNMTSEMDVSCVCCSV